jgi:glycosyltransferase involved in cell wall biosynthesis
MNILHLIDTVEKVNYGIWNAALINTTELKKYSYTSYALFPKKEFDYPSVNALPFNEIDEIDGIIQTLGLTKENTLVVSHGVWRWPSKVGAKLKSEGFSWMVLPHGMLEPWSLGQKAWKKKIYWHLFEKRYLKKASHIRAVSKPEYDNLKKEFESNLGLIHNCIDSIQAFEKVESTTLNFLFMARIHHKKGIIPLVKAWSESKLASNSNYKLTIAGPDDGQAEELTRIAATVSNVEYLGAVYGAEKESLLKTSDVYVLPSFSEGFPSSVIEAMSYGLLPLISEGCNFPEAFESDVAMGIEPNQDLIVKVLNSFEEMTKAEITQKGVVAQKYVLEHFTNEVITKKLHDLYQEMIKK